MLPPRLPWRDHRPLPRLSRQESVTLIVRDLSDDQLAWVRAQWDDVEV